MKNLKTILFESTYDKRLEYEGTVKTFGPWSPQVKAVGAARDRFCLLYSIIEKAGLEDEYNKWLSAQR